MGTRRGAGGKFEGGATGDRVFGFVFFGIRLGGHGFFLAEIPPWRKNKRFLARTHEKPFRGARVSQRGVLAFHGEPFFSLAAEYLCIS